MQVIARVASEINIKSSQVKARFLRRLIKNIKVAFAKNQMKVVIEDQWSRLYVTSDDPRTPEVLAAIFGIDSFAVIEHRSSNSFEAISEVITEHYSSRVEGQTVCLRVRKIEGKKDFSSQEWERELGGHLASFARGVDLSHPDFCLQVEVGQQQALYYSKSQAGPGGLPLGVEGHGLCLFSGGFDSALAAWQMMKRGVTCDFVLFNMGGASYEDSVVEVAQALERKWIHGYQPQFYVLNFEGLTDAIRHHIRPKLAQVVLKRCFYRLGSMMAAQNSDYQVLITGEAIGQVSSQTLANLVAIDSAALLPVLRPLITYNKAEIIALNRKIGTHDFCEKIKEYCAITPRYPATRAFRDQLEQEEQQLPQAIFDEIVTQMRLRNLVADQGRSTYAEIHCSEIIAGSQVIDTRSQAEYRHWHYPGSKHKLLAEIHADDVEFNKETVFIFVCAIGLETASLAEKLQKSGIKAKSFKGGIKNLQRLAQSQNLNW